MIQLHHGPTQPLIHVLPQWAEQAAQMIADAIVRQARQHGRCRLALTGSKQALPVYSALKRLLPTSVYSHLWLTWTDELVLPVANDIQPGQWQQMDPHSHLYQCYHAWLAHVPVVTEQVLPLVLHGDGPQDLVRFGREFQSKFSGGVDIALFGLGSHGQIASYWPGHPALDVEDVALLIHDAPGDHPLRVALAPPVFGQAQTAVVLASQGKRAPHVLTGLQDDQQWPLARVARHPHGYWLLDRAAAGPLVAEFLATEVA